MCCLGRGAGRTPVSGGRDGRSPARTPSPGDSVPPPALQARECSLKIGFQFHADPDPDPGF